MICASSEGSRPRLGALVLNKLDIAQILAAYASSGVNGVACSRQFETVTAAAVQAVALLCTVPLLQVPLLTCESERVILEASKHVLWWQPAQ